MKLPSILLLGSALLSLNTLASPEETATLLQWQKADAPVVLVEEVMDPDFRIGQKLAVRVLAETDSMIQPGTLILLDTEGISPATQGPARRWLVNLQEVQNLRLENSVLVRYHGKHIGTEGVLHLCVLVQLIQNHIRIGILSQLDH